MHHLPSTSYEDYARSNKFWFATCLPLLRRKGRRQNAFSVNSSADTWRLLEDAVRQSSKLKLAETLGRAERFFLLYREPQRDFHRFITRLKLSACFVFTDLVQCGESLVKKGTPRR